jgi:hypothetical protein
MGVIKMSDAPNNSNLSLSSFDNTLWQQIKALYQWQLVLFPSFGNPQNKKA